MLWVTGQVIHFHGIRIQVIKTIGIDSRVVNHLKTPGDKRPLAIRFVSSVYVVILLVSFPFNQRN